MREIYDPELLGLTVQRLDANNEAIVFCPYHADSHASAEYNLEKGVFFCFGCQESKTARQLATDLGGTLVPVGETYSPKILSGEPLSWARLMNNGLAYNNEYLESRGVSNEMVSRYDLRASGEGIIFPSRDIFAGLTGCQIRHYTRSPKYKFYGARQKVWPMQNLLRERKVFFTEGVFGALRALSAGFNAVAIQGATSSGSVAEWISKLDEYEPIAAMDSDYAGLLAAGKFVLNGIPALLPPEWIDRDPDDWTTEEWRYRYAKGWRLCHDVNDIIDRSATPSQLSRALEKYWEKL